MSIQITWQNWIDQFKPITNNPTASYDGLMFETFGEDLQKVEDAHPNTVWTLLDDGENQTIAAGRHLVNRQGFFITEKHYPDFIEIDLNDGEDEIDGE